MLYMNAIILYIPFLLLMCLHCLNPYGYYNYKHQLHSIYYTKDLSSAIHLFSQYFLSNHGSTSAFREPLVEETHYSIE